MMNKNIIIAILILIIVAMVGLYAYDKSRVITLNDYFDKTGDYASEWNNTTKEITVEKVFPLKFNETYENVTTEVSFYTGYSAIGDASVVNDTHDGKLVVHTSVKLPEEPTRIEFDIHDGVLIESDIEAIEFVEHYHWF